MDRELFQRIRSGSREAFNELFDAYYVRLCFFANRFLHDMDQSRSLVQQVFVDLWIKRETIEMRAVKSYLFMMVKNAVLDLLKHRKVELNFLSGYRKEQDTVSFNDRMEEAELDARINAAIRNLPPRCREIFVLCRFEEMSYSEIARHLNLSVKTVEMQISIALRKLRLELSEDQMINLLIFIFQKNRPSLTGCLQS